VCSSGNLLSVIWPVSGVLRRTSILLAEEAGATMVRQRVTHVQQHWGGNIYPAAELQSCTAVHADNSYVLLDL
jgi:hypothetical protein